MIVVNIILLFMILTIFYLDIFTKGREKSDIQDTGTYDDGCQAFDASVIPITKYEIIHGTSFGLEFLIYTPIEYFNVKKGDGIILNSLDDTFLKEIDKTLFSINEIRNWDRIPEGNLNCLSLKSIPESIIQNLGTTKIQQCNINVQISDEPLKSYISNVKVSFCVVTYYLQMKIEGPMNLDKDDTISFTTSGTTTIDTYLNGKTLKVDKLRDYNYVCEAPGSNPDAIRIAIAKTDYDSLKGTSEYTDLNIEYSRITESYRPRQLKIPLIRTCDLYVNYIEIFQVQFFKGELGRTNVVRFRVLDPNQIINIQPGNYVFLKLSLKGDYNLNQSITNLMNTLDRTVIQVKKLTIWGVNPVGKNDTIQFDYPIDTTGSLVPDNTINGSVAFFSAAVYKIPSCVN